MIEFGDGTEKLRGVIYAIVNKANAKYYIGQTITTAQQRMYGHSSEMRRGIRHPLYDSLRKHGLAAFKLTILEQCELPQLSEREIFWVAKMNSVHPGGYNLTHGGESGAKCELARKNMAANRIGKMHSAETKKRIGDMQRGKPKGPSPRKGIPLSESHRAAIGRGLKGNIRGPRSDAVIKQVLKRERS